MCWAAFVSNKWVHSGVYIFTFRISKVFWILLSCLCQWCTKLCGLEKWSFCNSGCKIRIWMDSFMKCRDHPFIESVVVLSPHWGQAHRQRFYLELDPKLSEKGNCWRRLTDQVELSVCVEYIDFRKKKSQNLNLCFQSKQVFWGDLTMYKGINTIINAAYERFRSDF